MIQKWLFPFIINFKPFFLLIIGLGTVVTLGSNSWWIGWIGMEINLMGFLVFILNKYNNENTFKYFITQSLGSVLLISSSLFLENNFNLFTSIALLSLMLKLGAAPLHYWLQLVVESFNRFQCLVILTWQKLAPLFIVVCLPQNFINWLFIISSIIVGVLGSLNEIRLFTLLTYSSIRHTGWIIYIIIVREFLSFFYLIIYFFIMYSVLKTINRKILYSNWFSYKKSDIINFIRILSLGGLPPFVGFILKWILLIEVLKYNFLFLLSLLILSSIILLYAYIRLLVNTFLRNKFIFLKSTKNNYNYNLFNILNLPLLFVFL